MTMVQRPCHDEGTPAAHSMNSAVLEHITPVFCLSVGLAAWTSSIRARSGSIGLLTLPSWWTEHHLLFVLCGLSGTLIAALLWGAILRRRMLVQTEILRRTMEEEAARERRQAFLERERSRVLEAINSSMPLDQVLGMITAFISEEMHGLCCWCVPLNGIAIGCANARGVDSPGEGTAHTRRDIHSSSGEPLGVFILDGIHEPGGQLAGSELLDLGVSLAALAIDNRRLYEDLIHRSEYDQLTDVPNRFLLECRIASALSSAQRYRQQFALIYIDLDQFKRVNDRYGHRVGDVYLQKVAKRLSERLRSRDTLARVGGDEFIALIPALRDRGEANEIARRLEDCFNSPFNIDDLILNGTASVGIAVYPEDGTEAHELKLVADAAMYASKHRDGSRLRQERDLFT
jgi:diguanylate cyclase (GGDEF)-like protein